VEAVLAPTRAEPGTLADLITPAAVVDLDVMHANLDRMQAYASDHGLSLRPHTKTHKSSRIAEEQLSRGAVGVTVATLREAEVMSRVATDILLAYPPVGAHKLARLLALPAGVRITVAADSLEVLRPLADAAKNAEKTVGVLVELDVGMRRVGVASPQTAVTLARFVADAPALEYRGVMFYPGHIRERVDEQGPAVTRLDDELQRTLDALTDAGLPPGIVSGGSTPAANASHRVHGMTEMRPGTYIFNDRTTAVVGACAWEECAYTILATVVSTAVPGQAVVDAGAKALAREELKGTDAPGFGALLDRPEVIVRALSEEHGILDLLGSDWRPEVGERVRVVPNHVCVSVNLQPHVFGARGDRIVEVWEVEARGWG
jgi:D-serine deaminase-like pyridoxal phosphate-dependent protein